MNNACWQVEWDQNKDAWVVVAVDRESVDAWDNREDAEAVAATLAREDAEAEALERAETKNEAAREGFRKDLEWISYSLDRLDAEQVSRLRACVLDAIRAAKI